MKQKDGKAVVLLSGGMDSAVALYDTLDDGYQVLPLFVDYGQRNLKHERAACCELSRGLRGDGCVPLSAVRLGLAGFMDVRRGDKSTNEGAYVPARNLILASLAVSYAEHAGADFVVLGLHAGSRYPDTKYEFLEALRNVTQKATIRDLDVTAPFMYMTKKEIVLRGKDLGVPFELTWSCLSPSEPSEEGEPCGWCNGCADRQRVLE